MERLEGYTLRHAFEVHRAVERTITIDEVAGYGIDLATTLRPAFEDPAMSIVELSHAHCEIVPRLVSELRRDVPPALDALVARCLAKEPSARPDSAHTVLNALRAVRSHFEARLAGAVAISDAAMTDVSPPPSVTLVDAPLPSTERELPGEGESEVFVGAGAPDSSQDAATEVSERRKR